MPVTTVTLLAPALPSSRSVSPRRAPGRTVPRVGGAVLGGVLTSMAFPATAWWWTAPAGVAVLILTVSGPRVGLPRSTALGALAGSAFALTSVN